MSEQDFIGPPAPASYGQIIESSWDLPPEMFTGYLPEPAPRTGGGDWLTDLWQPWDAFGHNLWETGVESIEQVSQKLPELLWERGLREIGLLPKQSVVREGAGVTVVHTQAPQAGGAPAQPIQKIIPGKFPVYAPGAPPKAAVISTSVLLVAGLLLFILLRK